jgi:nucleotide-binding universal stress UspA family protein
MPAKHLKVLFATDFSPNAKSSLKSSEHCRAAFHANTHLINVIESFWKGWLTSGLNEKEAVQRLESWQKEFLKEEDKSKLHVEQGNLSETILSKAKEINADLIMLGSKNIDNKGSRYKSGVTLEAVVRSASQPVLVCKGPIKKKILCAIDISEHSTTTLNWGIDLARTLSCDLTIISVLPKVNFNPLGMSDAEIKKHEDEFEKQQIAKAEAFLATFDFTGITVDKQYPWGTPSNVILDTAEDNNYDLIVIGARGHSRLNQVLIGSTAEKVLRHTPCSLLVVR